MKLHSIPAIILTSVLATGATPAATVYSNDFEGDTLGTLAVGDTLGGAGGVVGTGSAVTDVGFVSTAFGTIEMGSVFDVADDSWFNSGFDFDSLLPNAGDSSGAEYTMAAWLNYPSVGANNPASARDRFVFGTRNGTANQELHLGIRRDDYHSGHWNDDIGTGGTLASNNIGNWHFVVWTNDSAGTQEIFVDGVSVVSGATGTSGKNFGDLVIGGTQNSTDRDYIGQIGGFAVFDTVLTTAQQQSVALSVAVPEPSRAILLGLGLSLLCVRRRR